MEDEALFGFLEILADDERNQNLDDLKNDSSAHDLENIALLEIELIGKAFWELEPHLREKARNFASRLILQFLEGTFGNTQKLATYISKPIHRSEDFLEFDLESTLEAKIDNPFENTVPWGYQRRTTRTPIILLIDTSFSMTGTKLMIAGTVAATLARLVPVADLCIVGFSKRPYDIKRFDEDISSYHLVSRVLKLTPRGYTNLSGALARGRQLITDFPYHSQLILLSDAEPTTGKNPFVEASKLPALDLLLFPGGNEWVAKRLTQEAKNGRLRKISKISLIPQVLESLFS